MSRIRHSRGSASILQVGFWLGACLTIGPIRFAGIGLMVVAGQAQQPTNSGAAGSSSRLPLLPGDAIRIASWRETELKGDYLVDEMGKVNLPLLGERTVTGIPIAELKAQILAAYGEQLRNQEVQVTLLRRVSVLGAVGEPGVYLIDPTVGVPELLAMAGGTTRDGNLKSIRIRRGRQIFRLSRDSSIVGRELNSGDEITVPERSWLARNGQFVIGGALSAVAILVSRAF